VNQGGTNDYSLRRVTSGFVNRQSEVVINSTTCRILARNWPEWLTIESILNMSTTWICLQDSCFVQSLACLLPNITFLDYTPNILVPSVDYIICSHMMLIPKVGLVRTYSIPPWEMNHLPREIDQQAYNIIRITLLCVTSYSQPLINTKHKFQVTNYLQTIL
jgi:hypothetical protein